MPYHLAKAPNNKLYELNYIMCPKKWSERRGSNPRHRPWQGRTLPTELISHIFKFCLGNNNIITKKGEKVNKNIVFFLEMCYNTIINEVFINPQPMEAEMKRSISIAVVLFVVVSQLGGCYWWHHGYGGGHGRGGGGYHHR